jgi:hypothetical protein
MLEPEFRLIERSAHEKDRFTSGGIGRATDLREVVSA